jgi:WD40 repeat protein
MRLISSQRTVVTSFNPKTTLSSSNHGSSSSKNGGVDDDSMYYDEGDWVLCVASNPIQNIVSCALSNGEIQLYDQTTMHLLDTYQRNSLVTEMTFQTYDANLLGTSSNDGTITLYDIRQQQSQNPAIEITNMLRPDEEALCLSMGFDGNIAAVGSNKSKVHFFDIRHQRTLLGSYTQAHTDEVTRVRFQTQHAASSSSSLTGTSTTPILVSCSEDGLACVFDTSQPTEESALTNILSVQSPIREIGFFGIHQDAVYCLTGSETLHIYHKDDPTCRNSFGGLSLRNDLSTALLQSYNNDTVAGMGSGGKNVSLSPIEYLVDCYWDPIQQKLSLLAGSTKGDAALFHVEGPVITPKFYLNGGHRGVIRSWTPTGGLSGALSSFLTVGEDARMCEWSHLYPVHTSGSTLSTTSMMEQASNPGPQIILANTKRKRPESSSAGGGKLRRPRSRLRSTPY